MRLTSSSFPFTFFFLSLATLLPALAWAQSYKPVEADRIVAVVNNEVITLRELQAGVVSAEAQLRQQGTELPSRDVFQRHILERMIVDRAQVQTAKETGIRVDDAELNRALTSIAERNRLTMDAFRAALEKDGLAWTKFREDIRNEILLSRLKDREVDSRITVTDGEIDNFLANAENLGGNEELNLAHILLRVPEQAKPDQLTRIKAKAEDLVSQLKKGAAFAKLAAANSDAPDALSGGAMGWRPRDRLPAIFMDTLNVLKLGEVSDVIRSPAGYHIIKLLDKRGGKLTAQPVQQTHARHILIKTSQIVSQEEAVRRLVVLKERIDNGADFAEMARLHSNDLSSSKGGDLGWMNAGETVPEFERAMNGLKINELSGPVTSQFGAHLIQVLERRTDVSQERLRQNARLAIRERKADEEYQDWVRQIRDRAYVEYRLDENK